MSSPPYDPAKLHPPLTPTQRGNMIVWMELQDALGAQTGTPLPKNIRSVDDNTLIGYYQIYAALYNFSHSPITGPPNPLNGLKGIWKDVPWERLGEILVGVIFVAVGAKAVLGSTVNNGAKTKTRIVPL